MGTSRADSWLIFGLFTAVGLLLFSSTYFEDLARGATGTALARFVEEMTGSWTVWLIVPLVRRVASKATFTRAGWFRSMPLLVAGVAAYTVVHTTLMLVSRSFLFPLAGLGRYDYGNMLFRYPMEGAKDVIVFAVMIAWVVVFDRIARGSAAEVQAASLEAELTEARLTNLQLQLQPHFLFNTLNAISAVMYEDVAKADAMLTKLSDFLRTVLDSSGVQRVSVLEELRVERMYVDIMRARLERALDLRVSIADDAVADEIPFMLLQPLLENAIRHGLGHGRTALDIDVDVRRSDDDLVIDVRDDGCGFEAGAKRGYGLRNVESRLIQSFGAAATFSIGERDGGGTHVRLSYPHTASGPAR